MLQIFIDESGDLGWKFDKPYRNGGSSRFLTLAFLLVESDSKEYPKRLVRKFRKKAHLPTNIEFKAYNLREIQILKFSEEVAHMMEIRQNIRLIAITVKKENVQAHIRHDPNKLYNYMVNLALMEEVVKHKEAILLPDNRSIKVASGNSLVDYLQTQIWFEHNAGTTLTCMPQESRCCQSIQFTDIVSHIVWNFYENRKSEPLRQLAQYIRLKRLFFHSS
jgi:hypothetical protein